MDKTKPDQALSGRPIAKKIVAKMKLYWQRKVVNIKNVIVGHAIAEELQKTVVSQKELEGHCETAPKGAMGQLSTRIQDMPTVHAKCSKVDRCPHLAIAAMGNW